MLLLLILILLTSRATFVAIMKMHLPSLFLSYFLLNDLNICWVCYGFNMSNIKLSKHNNDMRDKFYSKQKLDRFLTSEKSSLLLIESDGHVEIVEKSI